MRVNGVNKFLLFFAKLYEQKLGKAIGDYNLCVSKAMSVDLTNHFMLDNVTVLYDAATKKFSDLGVKGGKGFGMKEKHELFKKLRLGYEEKKETGNELTMFTEYNWQKNEYKYRENRPILCLSSTSYTPDEDFNVLVKALDILDNKLESQSSTEKRFPKL